MYPNILSGDVVIVMKCDDFKVGEIFVFHYDVEGYKIHRLLSIKDDLFYFKGDNAFRIEKVNISHILGRVMFVERNEQTLTPSKVCNDFIKMSLKIGEQFELYGANIMNTSLYLEYKRLYLH